MIKEECIAAGYSFERHISLSEHEISKFAHFCGDDNPVHHDAEYAKNTRFGRIIASGPHVISLFTAMVATHFSRLCPMVGLKFSYEFTRPIFAESSLTLRWEVESVAPTRQATGIHVYLDGFISCDGTVAIKGKGLALLSEHL